MIGHTPGYPDSSVSAAWKRSSARWKARVSLAAIAASCSPRIARRRAAPSGPELGGLLDHGRLQRMAHQVGFFELVERDAGHEGAGTRDHFDQAFIRQPLHGLVHRRAAGAELLGDVTLDDARAGQHAHLHDALAQAEVDAARGAQAGLGDAGGGSRRVHG
jgi:hypothetical protein